MPLSLNHPYPLGLELGDPSWYEDVPRHSSLLATTIKQTQCPVEQNDQNKSQIRRRRRRRRRRRM